MTAIYLPPHPVQGQEYVAINGATYTWLGNRWSSTQAIKNRTAAFYIEGGDSTTWATAEQINPGDNVLDGGTSTG